VRRSHKPNLVILNMYRKKLCSIEKCNFPINSFLFFLEKTTICIPQKPYSLQGSNIKVIKSYLNRPVCQKIMNISLNICSLHTFDIIFVWYILLTHSEFFDNYLHMIISGNTDLWNNLIKYCEKVT
jgi:hypothetical protein